jgi:hypothetical protein
MKSKMSKFVGRWRFRIWLLAIKFHITDLLSDASFVKLMYFSRLGKFMRNPPVDFNEKLQWLKVHYRHPLIPICADKYAVRECVREQIGEAVLNECIGVYENADDIDFASLPNQFVLKCTHGSSWNIVCDDKTKLDVKRTVKLLNKWLSIDFSRYGREWQYHYIKPRIVCERFLRDNSSERLCDFKVFTFNGRAEYIWVDYYKNSKHYRNVYNCTWEFQPEKGSRVEHGEADDVKRPECLEEMISYSMKLASPFPQCRVDYYVLENRKLVFGEMTFTSGGGCNEFYPQAFNDELGGYIDLQSIDSQYVL